MAMQWHFLLYAPRSRDQSACHYSEKHHVVTVFFFSYHTISANGAFQNNILKTSLSDGLN